MNDLVNDSKQMSRKSLSKLGVGAVFQVIGGAALLILGALPVLPAAVVGGVLTVLGLVEVFSKDPQDKRVGALLTVAGVAGLLSKFGVIPLLRATSGAALRIGGFVLLGFGVWSAVRFIMGLKKRS
jgi:hypothetical protein